MDGRSISRRVAVFPIIACLALGGHAETKPSLARIPTVRLHAFSGEAIPLPEALRGKVGILVIGFSRGSQRAVTEWARKLTADYGDSPTVLYYEMPMLASVPGPFRGLVVRQMRSAVPRPAWPRFAPLTEDEKTWRALTHYAAADDAYVLLVDGEGIVRWQTHGSPTNLSQTALKQQADAILEPGH